MQVSNILYQIDMKKQAIQLDTLKNNCNTANNKNINLNKSPLAVYNVAFQGIRLQKIPNKLEIFGGCLLGGAIGDAFGANIEFLNLNQIKEQYGADITKLEKDSEKTKKKIRKANKFLEKLLKILLTIIIISLIKRV